MKQSVLTGLSAALLAILPSSAFAEQSEWEHYATVYMVGASLGGTVGDGPVEGSVSAGFSDILDNLELGAMASYRGERGPWAVVADIMYMKLENQQTGQGPLEQTDVKLESDQLIIALDGARKITDHIDVYGGLRYWDLDTRIGLAIGPGGVPVTTQSGDDWIDPVVGLRFATPLGQRWQFVAKGDVGGFGIGSDFTWHVTTFVSYNLTAQANLLLGFRYIDVDYESGSGLNRFKYDVRQGGPTAGFAWRF